MTAARRTGRPLQALAVLGALLAGWIAGRWPLLEREVALAVARAEQAQLFADAAERRVASTRNVVGFPTRVHDERILVPWVQERDAFISSQLVVPAMAGTPRRQHPETGPRLRGDDGSLEHRRAQSHGSKTGAALAVASAPPATAAAASTASATAFDFAARAYAALAAGNHRLAAEDFDAALATDSADPHVPVWAAARRALGRRWSASAYAFARPDDRASVSRGPGLSPGTTPLLGGSQSGAALAYALDPLARRPLDLTARVAGGTGSDQRQAEAAVGLRWRLFPGVSVSAERLIALGPQGRHDWTLRLAGGRAARIGPVALDGYGETGIVGVTHPTLFAAGQTRVGYPLALTPAFTLTPGAGVWAGVQHDRFATTDRVDAGPSLRLHWVRAKLPIDIAVDYRRRLAGNAAPGSGAALTLSTGF